MSLQKLARGMVEIPKGLSTSYNENSQFMSTLERTNTLLAQFLSAPEEKRMMFRTDLEEAYFNVTLNNLKDSIKHKIEQDMWNNLFKKHISELQGKMKSKDKIEAAKAQSELSLFLDEAMGFYSKFLDVLSWIHNIRLPGRPINNKKSLIRKDVANRADVSEEDLSYIVQHCFVHLGDLSRYHNLHKLARRNYQWAVELNPGSGHAYNQLAILESSSVSQVLSNTNYNRLLHTILYYDYANTCSLPFPATRINLDSLLRHIHQESVSELLTSNNSVDAHNCLSSLAVAWLHTYADMSLRNNIQRCRQLQQRIVQWITELVKYQDVSVTHWRDIVIIVALQCALLSAYDQTQETIETRSWNTNLQQFTQDLLNALCHGLVSISHDEKLMANLFSQPSCLSIVVVFLAWFNQFLVTGNDEKCIERKFNLSVPFGEQFVKFLNILRAQLQLDSPISDDISLTLPTSLPELQFLSGYQPLKIPSKTFNIFSAEESPQNQSDIDDTTHTRRLFIVSVAMKITFRYRSLLLYDNATDQFINVPAVVETVSAKKPPKIEPLIATKKYINVALSSIKSNNMEQNGTDKRKNILFNAPTSTETTYNAQPATTIVTDVKIAKYIQEHIANETSISSSVPDMISPTRDESHGMAPAPGLILSSNLPPEYKTMAVVTSNTSNIEEIPIHCPSPSLSHTGDLMDPAKSLAINTKAHPYNPNREQFEKDLPPRFANKRGSSQKETKSGFKSLNYWDSNSAPNKCEPNLTMKESEMLIPPIVPTSWLNDEHHERSQRHSLDANMGVSNLHFSMPDTATNQQQTSFSNQMQHNPMSMFQPSFNQYQNHAMPDQDNSMKQYIQTTSPNLNNFSYHQSSSDMIDHSRLNFDKRFMTTQTTAQGMQHNFPPIPPPPPPSQVQSSLLSGGSTSNTGHHMMQNYDQFTMSHQNYYDKPIFSTSNQAAFGGYNTTSIMAQQQQQQQQHHQMQQHKHNHQVRSNNPLLNLLPGFMNEMQR